MRRASASATAAAAAAAPAASLDGDDEVLAELDVVVHHELDGQLHALSHILRPAFRPPGAPAAARLRPERSLIELECVAAAERRARALPPGAHAARVRPAASFYSSRSRAASVCALPARAADTRPLLWRPRTLTRARRATRGCGACGTAPWKCPCTPCTLSVRKEARDARAPCVLGLLV